MAFPDLAYPEPGWISRFVGRTEQFELLEKIINSTHRGTPLPLVQVTGPDGVGKSWFLQRLRWNWRNRIDVPVLALRFSIPAMTQWDKAIDGLVSRLISRWKMNLRLTEFVLGRIAHLKGENFERFSIYETARKYLPNISTSRGENDMRRVLVEKGVDILQTLWGPGWGKRFLSMSPRELSWYLPQLLGLDIDPALRSSRFRAFVLLVDDADIIPELYHSLLRMKKYSTLTLPILASRQPASTGGCPVETIPLDSLPLLERRAYLYSLGIDDHYRQNRISAKFGGEQCKSSILYAIGALEQKQIISRNPALQKLLGTLLICHRPSLDVLQEITKDSGAISAFFAEPELVDLLEQPDRLPWRFILHPVARKWIAEKVKNRPRPNAPYGEVVGRLALFANRDFNMGMPVLYWFFRDAMVRCELDNATDAIMTANEVADNVGFPELKRYHHFLHLDIFCPPFGRSYMMQYARRLVFWRRKNDEEIELLVAARCFLKTGRNRLALWTARSILPKISAKAMEQRGKNVADMLLRGEANRIIGLALTRCGEIDNGMVALDHGREATTSVQNKSRALADEAVLQQIHIDRAIAENRLENGEISKAWNIIKNAMDILVGMMGGIGYKEKPILDMSERLFEFLFAHRLWEHEPAKVMQWLKRIMSICDHRIKERDDILAKKTHASTLIWASRVALELTNPKQAMEWLNEAELMLPSLGEKFLWLSEHWHAMSVEIYLLKADVYATMGNMSNSYEQANQALAVIQRWNLAENAIYRSLAARTRIIGGIALSRMERLEEASAWLSAGVPLAEQIFNDDPMGTKSPEMRVLGGDAYHEMARIAFHKKDMKRAIEMAKLGIEHRLLLMDIAENQALHLDISELYMLLLEALPRNDVDTIYDAISHAVAIVLSACSYAPTDRTRCIMLAEGLFRFAINAAKTMKIPDSNGILVWALSLYPLIRNGELIEQARTICGELSTEQVPDELIERYKKLESLIEEFGKIEDIP